MTPSVDTPYGGVVFAASGTSYNWTVPANIYFISVVAVGAGGGLISTTAGSGGAAGGSLVYGNNIAVTPGEVLTITAGVAVQNGAGSSSLVVQGGVTILSAGGGGRSNAFGVSAPTWGGTKATDGGNGGAGGGGGAYYSGLGGTLLTTSGGSGGAGGYGGNGGNGTSVGSTTITVGASGTAGGGAGGAGQTGGGPNSGGGVGIYGQGSNGVYPGGAGSGGSGVTYGGGRGNPSGEAGDGVVRIIWGIGRAFPSTNVSMPETPTPTPTPTQTRTPTTTRTPTLTVTSTYSQSRFYIGAGGGGAGSNGIDASYSAAGNGGAGILNTITGTPAYYAGGGGGGAWPSKSGGLGGIGGGGAGNVLGVGGAGTSGTANTGGGGGASSSTGGITAGAAGNGGSGIVVIKYRASSELLNNDPYFNKNISLIHANGDIRGNGNILDSSNNYTLSVNNTSSYGLIQGSESPYRTVLWAQKFRSGSIGEEFVYNATRYPAVRAITNGYHDWTMEFWCYAATASNQGPIKTLDFSFYPVSTIINRKTYLTISNGASNVFLTNGTIESPVNTWNHYAITHNSHSVAAQSFVNIYVNGRFDSSASRANVYRSGSVWDASDYLAIGSETFKKWEGYISNFRLVTGSILYTASFTPPQKTLQRIQNTAFLIAAGEDFRDSLKTGSLTLGGGGSTNFAFSLDNTATKLKTNFYGNPLDAPTASYSPVIHGSSIYSEKSNAYVSTNNPFLVVDSGSAFTIDFWFNSNSFLDSVFVSGSSTSSLYMAYRNVDNVSSPNYYYLAGTGSRADIYLDYRLGSSSGSVPLKVGLFSIKPNAWHHIALSRSTSSLCTVYMDGSSLATFTNSEQLTGQSTIGPFDGYMSDFRITSGAYIPSVPTSPLTASSDTQLLVTGNNSKVYDYVGMNSLITRNIDVSTVVKKVGFGSLFFNGSSSYAYSKDWPSHITASKNQGSVFTIESWVYPVSISKYTPIYSTGDSGNSGFIFGIETNGKLKITNKNTSSSYASTSSISVATGSWTHIAASTSATSSNLTLFINGTPVGKISTASIFPTSPSISGSFASFGLQGYVGQNSNMIWKAGSNGFTTGSGWTGVTYGGGFFVAVASSGTYRVMNSTDGIAWTLLPIIASEQWQSVTYGNGLFVAVASSGTNAVMTSSGSVDWTYRTAFTGSWNSVAYGSGKFVAVGNNSKTISSTDGITWISSSAYNNNWREITYGDGKFVAVGTGSGLFMTSPDGQNWTTSSARSGNFWTSVAYGNGLFVAVSADGTNQIATSPDGIDWTFRASPVYVVFTGITYGGGLFVAVGYSEYPVGYALNSTNKTVIVSKDGIVWNAMVTPADTTFQNVTYGNGIFAAVANGARVASNTRTMYAIGDTDSYSYFHGYMDEFRYTNDFCRYIGPFTPYKRQFQNRL